MVDPLIAIALLVVSILLAPNVKDAVQEKIGQKVPIWGQILAFVVILFAGTIIQEEVLRQGGGASTPQNQMIEETYLEPTMTILNEYELKEEMNADNPEVLTTTYILRKADSESEFTIDIQADNADTVTFKEDASNKTVEAVSGGDGRFSFVVNLDSQEKYIDLTAENKQKSSHIRLLLIRGENASEAESRIAIETANREWEESEAGQLCKKYPHWTEEECKKLADNKIWIGMSREMLVELRGLPNSANPSNYGYGTQWQWCWWYKTPSCFYDDNEDGLVDSYN